jgi:YhcH/YjgK/YiaL family protein
MIFDKLENLKKYLTADDYKKIKCFLDTVSPDMPEGFYPIDGDHIFAKVMSYETKSSEHCAIEAHNKYIDIHSTLYGAELIDVFPRAQLTVEKPYNEKDDAEFYVCEGALIHARTNNYPGYFSLIFPYEAHRPKGRVEDIETVKKFVIKLEADT